jgi:hypothetical protein
MRRCPRQASRCNFYATIGVSGAPGEVNLQLAHRPAPCNSPPPTTISNCRDAQRQVQPTASSQPTAPRPISLHGQELPHVQHFRYLGSYFSKDAALTRKSAGEFQQRVQQCSGLQSSGAAGTSPLAPKLAYMAALRFRSCCMEQSPGPSRPPSCSGLRFSIVGFSAAFLGLHWRDGISTEKLLRQAQQCHIGTTIRCLLLLAGPCHADAL